ncbi:MAG: protein-disulfide reductase DsbD [Steroidobacteraceae bacterium]
MRPFIRHIPLVALLGFACAGAWAQPAEQPPGKPTGIDAVLKAARTSGDQFLEADQAFRLSASAEGTDQARLNWEIADGYYLYRARIKVATSSAAVQLGAPQLPPGQFKNDEYFGRQEVYHHGLRALVPIARDGTGAFDLPLQVTYQGCAEAGLCYPPITSNVSVHLPARFAGAADAGGGASAAAGATAQVPAGQDWFAGLIRGGNPLIMLGWFYVAGLLLAFTPCVLPMVPILAGIIAGGGSNITTGRAFALSLTYVLGMALTYTLAGIAGAAAGSQIQTLFQQWWVLVLFAALFVVLALSMFGAFTLQMPSSIQARVAQLSNRQSAGTLGGVAIMGALSALIVTTCVGPALVGALLVISQTGQIARGGAALFAMSIGMGTPLLIVGASAGRLLPRAGPWMETVKKLFGVVMLAVAVWMLARVVPERLALLLWAVPALVLGWLLWHEARGRVGTLWALRGAGVAAGLYAMVLAAGAALGGTDPLAPIPSLASHAHELPFRPVKSVAELTRAVNAAKARGQGVLVDFSADWCTSCKEMERYTFTDARVHAALNTAVLLRADVTANDADDQALLRHFNIIGPPTIAFYGKDGQERPQYRVVGYMQAEPFAAASRAALETP